MGRVLEREPHRVVAEGRHAGSLGIQAKAHAHDCLLHERVSGDRVVRGADAVAKAAAGQLDQLPIDSAARAGVAGPLRGAIDDPAHHERAGEQECRPERHQERERGPASGIGPDEAREGAMW